MGLLIGVGGIMEELRRVRSGIQSEKVKKRKNFIDLLNKFCRKVW